MVVAAVQVHGRNVVVAIAHFTASTAGPAWDEDLAATFAALTKEKEHERRQRPNDGAHPHPRPNRSMAGAGHAPGEGQCGHRGKDENECPHGQTSRSGFL